jgi:AcrR family transcriptional regulator
MPQAESQSRRGKAQATKRKIIRAAHDEFTEKGFHGATIASIAARAGVATQTVYFVFHTKAGLMSAVIDTAVLGDAAVIPQETEWWKAMEATPDAVQAVTTFIFGAAPLFQRASAISEILRAAAQDDDEVRHTYEAHEEQRRVAFQQIIETLANKTNLRAGLTIDTATDLLMTLFSDATYQFLITNCGWHHDQLVDWLCQALPELILDTPQD